MGRHPGLSRWVQCNHKGQRQEGQNQREDLRMEAEIREERRHDAVGLGDARNGQKPRDAGDVWKLEKVQ